MHYFDVDFKLFVPRGVVSLVVFSLSPTHLTLFRICLMLTWIFRTKNFVWLLLILQFLEKQSIEGRVKKIVLCMFSSTDKMSSTIILYCFGWLFLFTNYVREFRMEFWILQFVLCCDWCFFLMVFSFSFFLPGITMTYYEMYSSKGFNRLGIDPDFVVALVDLWNLITVWTNGQPRFYQYEAWARGAL